jgi:hypothetical protein
MARSKTQLQAAYRRLGSLVGATALLGCVLGATGCAASGGDAPVWTGTAAGGETSTGMGMGGASPVEKQEPECHEGHQRVCKVFAQQQNGVHSCWVGQQTCTDGRWAECIVNDFAGHHHNGD